MELKVLTVNDDGSAICEFEMSAEELVAMAKVGILAALKQAVSSMEIPDESDLGEVSEGC